MMKKSALHIALISLVALSCDPEPVLLDATHAIPDGVNTGLYVLSEGLFNQNNSALAWIDYSTGLPYSWPGPNGTSYDCFEKSNRRRLGDTANDMILYRNRLYIVVSESSTIEILDASTCLSLKQIKLSHDGKASQPRYITAQGDYVYVCCFDGTVVRISTLTMEPDATVAVGRNPDGICCAGGKLYVSNSGGLDPSNPDSTVSVIDISTFTEQTRITVRSNPGTICTDGTSVFVVSRGIYDYGTDDYDCRLHRIDVQTDMLTHTYNIPVLNMDISDGKAWLYRYGSDTIQVMDTRTGEILQPCFITDGTRVERPYSIKVDPVTRYVYICDAANYTTPGSLYCFTPEGRLRYRVATGIGINPNTIQFTTTSVRPADAGTAIETRTHVSKVFSYCPAPGQFINTIPQYTESDDSVTMAQKCLEALTGDGMITLGAFGGYITVGFDSPVMNYSGPDFRIDGNAFTGSAEPGVVWVSSDVNHDGLPNDPWYEIWGSEQKENRSTHGYTITYYRPESYDRDIRWRGSDGRTGTVSRNNAHKQPYYPQWFKGDSVSFTATLLPENISYTGGMWVMESFGYGYVDNLPNSDTNSAFDISWAVKPDGQPANLESIDFIKVQNGVIGCNNETGEQSTEITAIYNINP
jgi:hypothetical protein